MVAYNTMIVLAGTGLLGATGGLIGTFAVLRRRALVGDAVAHAALPGLCLAFLIVGQRNLPALLTGALATGLTGTGVIALLRRWTRIKEDAAIGAVLSVFFGVGIVLSRLVQNRTAEGSKAGLDSYILGKTAGMTALDVYLLGGVALVCLGTVLLLYKELQLISFDPEMARAEGWPALALDQLLMALVAVTVVIGLPAAGVVMVAALLILPAAAARFWTDRLVHMLALSATLGAAIGIVGTVLSAHYSGLPTGPVIVLAGAVLLSGSVLLAPRRGGLARLAAQRRLRLRLAEQDLLACAHGLSQTDRPLTLPSLHEAKSWRRAHARRLLERARASGLVVRQADGSHRLTQTGARRATAVVQGRRLWRLFLCEYPDVAGDLVDLDAESIDEQLSPTIVSQLRSKLQAEWPVDEREAQVP